MISIVPPPARFHPGLYRPSDILEIRRFVLVAVPAEPTDRMSIELVGRPVIHSQSCTISWQEPIPLSMMKQL